jgi:hypothetical protein
MVYHDRDFPSLSSAPPNSNTATHTNHAAARQPIVSNETIAAFLQATERARSLLKLSFRLTVLEYTYCNILTVRVVQFCIFTGHGVKQQILYEMECCSVTK